MISPSQCIKKPFETIELTKLLDNLTERSRSISKVIHLPVRLEPFFHPGRGFFYPGVGLTTLEEQTRFLESLERMDVATRSPSISLMQCPFCGSHRFCSTFACKLCRSPNILRGSAIVHEPCGNIDFYDKYVAGDGTLVCQKCNKNLKAIGVDYSRLDHIYNCLDCKAMISDIGQFYKCIDCGKPSTLDESKITLLNEYLFDMDKLTSVVSVDKYILSAIKELDKLGIQAHHQATVTG